MVKPVINCGTDLWEWDDKDKINLKAEEMRTLRSL
jgi:hypothetical protein